MELLNLGISHGDPCGVRGYSSTLAQSLASNGHTVTTLWLDRPVSPSVVHDWLRELAKRASDVDVVLWHYSVFVYSYRGVPTIVWPIAALLRRAAVVTVLHEFAYAWRAGSWRTKVWAATQRAVLPAVIGSSNVLVVTTPERELWLSRQRWLPRRHVSFAPVMSPLPDVSSDQEQAAGAALRIGMLGYPATTAPLAAAAVAGLQALGVPAVMRLLGAPGQDSTVGKSWQRAWSDAGNEGALSFSGVVGEASLASELRGCDVLVFDDGAGPTARKTTLAACLASGRPVVAVDGPSTWSALVDEQAVRIVPRRAGDLRDELAALARDVSARHALAARGRAFYERHQSPSCVAATIERACSLAHLDENGSRKLGGGVD